MYYNYYYYLSFYPYFSINYYLFQRYYLGILPTYYNIIDKKKCEFCN